MLLAKFSKIGLCLKQRSGAVFLYVLFTVSIFMLIFSSLVLFLNRNLDFVAKSFVQNRLAFDAVSTQERVVGLFDVNPRHPALVHQSNGKRDVSVSGYENGMEGYVYQGKTDIWTLRSGKYLLDQKMPTSLTVTNTSDVANNLTVTVRLVNSLDNFVLNSRTVSLAPEETLAPAYSFLGADGTNVLLSGQVEIVLSNTSSEGALYTLAVDPPDGVIPPTALDIDVTSYENSKFLGTGESVQGQQQATVEYPSYNLAQKADFEGTDTSFNGLFSSSINQPGISTAYEDGFDIDSQEDYVTPANVNYNADSTVLLSNDSTYFLNTNLNENIDVRAVLQVPASLDGEMGIVLQDGGGGLYRAGIKTAAAYFTGQDNGNGSRACKPDILPGDPTYTYIFYDISKGSPSQFGDGSNECSEGIYPVLRQFDPGANTEFMLRFVRHNNQLDAYYCSSGSTCDVADYQWPLIREIPLDIAAGGAKVGFYTQGMTAKLDSWRVDRLNAPAFGTYEKTINFGKSVLVKKVELGGYVGTSDFQVLLNGVDQGSNMIFEPRDSQGKPLVTQSLQLQIQLQSDQGDLSHIPFIRSIRVFYEPE